MDARTKPTHNFDLTSPSRWRAALFLVGAIALAAAVTVIDVHPVGVFHDDAMYVILARSLATGQGYRSLNLPGSPAATHFPPAYPAFLALISWVAPPFPDNVAVFKAVNAVLLALGAVLLAHFARSRVVSAGWAIGLGAASAVCIPVLVLGSMVLSEPLFFVLLVALLPALESLIDRPTTARRALLLGVGIAVCALVRSLGIVLLPAALLALAMRRRWRDAGFIAAATVLCVLPWQLWVAVHRDAMPGHLLGNYENYASWWLRGLRATGAGMVPATLAKTVPETIDMAIGMFSPVGGTVAHVITFAAVVALAASGADVMWRRAPVTLLFIGGYLAIVLLWPFAPMRFVWAVWPLLLLVIVAGARAAAGAVNGFGRSRRVAIAAAFVWVVIGYGFYEVRGMHGAWWSMVPRANAERMVPILEWIAANTESDDVIAAEDEGAVYLYTGRKAVPAQLFAPGQYLRDYSVSENAIDGLGAILDVYPVRTVVAGTRGPVEAADFLVARWPARLKLRADFRGGVAYDVPRRPRGDGQPR